MSYSITKIQLWILMMSGIFFFLTCDEQIPEGPPLVQVLEANLSAGLSEFPQPSNFSNRYDTSHITNFHLLTDFRVRFQIKVTNTFDETVEGIDWTDIKIRLWSAQVPDLDKTLSFTYHNEETEWLILHPGDLHTLYTLDSLVWDQTDQNGEGIHKTESFTPFSVRVESVYNKELQDIESFCDTTFYSPTDTIVAFETPIEIQAQADVKIFKNYDSIKSNIFRFKIVYFFPAGMIDKRKCRLGVGG